MKTTSSEEGGDFAFRCLRLVTASTAASLGFKAATGPTLNVLADLLRDRLRSLASLSQRYAEEAGRRNVVLEDVGLALRGLGEAMPDLKDFASRAPTKALPFPVPALPVPKAAKPLYAPPPSQAELMSRSEAIPAFFPSIYPPTKAGKLAALRDSVADGPAARIRPRRTTSTMDRRLSRSASLSRHGLPDFSNITAESAGLVRWVDPPPPKVTIKPLPSPPSPPTPPSIPPLPPQVPSQPLSRPAPVASDQSSSSSPLKLKISGLGRREEKPASSLSSESPKRSPPKAKGGRPPGPKRRPPQLLKAKPKISVPKDQGSLKFLFPRPAAKAAESSQVEAESTATASTSGAPLPSLKLKLTPNKSKTPSSPKTPVKASTSTSSVKSAASSLPGIFGRSKTTATVAAADAKKKSALKIKLKLPPSKAASPKLHKEKSKKAKKAKKEKRETTEDGELSTTVSTSQEDVTEEATAEHSPLPKLKLKIKPIGEATPSTQASKESEPHLKLSLGGLLKKKGMMEASSPSPPPPATPGHGSPASPASPPHSHSTPQTGPRSKDSLALAPKNPSPSSILRKLTSGKVAKAARKVTKEAASKKAAKLFAPRPPPVKPAPKARKSPEDEEEEKIWICPVCGVAWAEDADMVACDGCSTDTNEVWFHWACVGLLQNPGDNDWFCPTCAKGRGGRGGGGAKKRRASATSSTSLNKRRKK